MVLHLSEKAGVEGEGWVFISISCLRQREPLTFPGSTAIMPWEPLLFICAAIFSQGIIAQRTALFLQYE